MLLLNHVHHVYPHETVEAIAAAYQAADEDGWTYTAVHDPKGTGHSIIVVHDEEGELVGKM